SSDSKKIFRKLVIEGVRMNTIIIEHADEKLTSLFRQMAEIAGVPLRTKPEKEGEVITNPEISKAIGNSLKT
ncbi:MAG TPA: hypothetical protein VKZ42_04395, partial [Flavobacteriaceae bacterium]|nr:hypothetical protein [Flavobacteriaceae bacterium]